MNNANKSGNLIGALAQKRAKIEESLPWKELGNEERVERLRNYVKNTIVELKANHQRETIRLQEQINKLQKHKHNEKGEAYVEHKLQSGEENIPRYSLDIPPMPSPTNTWMVAETESENGNEYI